MIFLSDATVHDTSITVSAIETFGLIALAIIGVWQVKITTKAKNAATSAKEEAKGNAVDAALSAQMAKDYAAALGIKDALVSSLEFRVKFLEEENRKQSQRLDDFETREEEHREQQRASALIEREYAEQIRKLTEEVEKLRHRQPKNS